MQHPARQNQLGQSMNLQAIAVLAAQCCKKALEISYR
jgi:hypothetical protein